MLKGAEFGFWFGICGGGEGEGRVNGVYCDAVRADALGRRGRGRSAIDWELITSVVVVCIYVMVIVGGKVIVGETLGPP